MPTTTSISFWQDSSGYHGTVSRLGKITSFHVKDKTELLEIIGDLVF